MARSAVVVCLTALASVLALSFARAEIPALSRGFETEEFSRDASDLEDLAQQREITLGMSGGAFWAGRDAGSWNAFRGGRPWGARADARASAGRWTLGAEATNDGALDAEPREYAQRITLAAHLPEALTALTGSVGYQRFHHVGTDVSAELAPLLWNLHLRTADVVPRVWFWTRYRKLEDDPKAIVTPATGIALQHFAVLGSQPVLALTVQSDLSDGRTPATFGMFQVEFASVERPLWGDYDTPGKDGRRGYSLTDRNWSVTLGYAFPLDDRSPARLTLQVGMRFVSPYGGH